MAVIVALAMAGAAACVEQEPIDREPTCAALRTRLAELALGDTSEAKVGAPALAAHRRVLDEVLPEDDACARLPATLRDCLLAAEDGAAAMACVTPATADVAQDVSIEAEDDLSGRPSAAHWQRR
jgi:hypothetical protein